MASEKKLKVLKNRKKTDLGKVKTRSNVMQQIRDFMSQIFHESGEEARKRLNIALFSVMTGTSKMKRSKIWINKLIYYTSVAYK